TPQAQQLFAARMVVATPFGPAGINSILTPEQNRKLRNGTAEERTEVLKSLPPDKRKEVLADLPANVIAYTPEFKEEAAEARRLRQQALQMEVRKRNPRLDDLLNQDQLSAVLSRVKDQVMAVLASLDPDKRSTVAALLPAQNLADFPELRRMAQFKRSPRLVA